MLVKVGRGGEGQHYLHSHCLFILNYQYSLSIFDLKQTFYIDRGDISRVIMYSHDMCSGFSSQNSLALLEQLISYNEVLVCMCCFAKRINQNRGERGGGGETRLRTDISHQDTLEL